MKLARINLRTNATEGKYRLTVPPHINEKLVSYAAMYKSAYSDDIPLETLMIGILDQFFEADAEFRVWRREHDEETAAQPTVPRRRSSGARAARKTETTPAGSDHADSPSASPATSTTVSG